MGTTIKYVVLTAIRDWLFVGLLVLLGMAAGVSYFLGSTALVEQEQMASAYVSGASRLILILGLVVFICFHVRRSFENREVEVILTRPITRNGFVFSYWAGFSSLGVILALILSLMMVFTLGVHKVGLLYWTLSLVAEMFMVIAFALACSLIVKSAVVSVFVSVSFYIISRLMGFFTVILAKQAMPSFGFSWLFRNAIDSVSMVIPRLDLFTKSSWLIYGTEGEKSFWLWDMVPIFVVQAAVFVPLLLFMAMYDFNRKQF